MRKKLLLGSLLVLILLLLMPSIPAIQLKTLENKAQNDIISQLENIDLIDLNNMVKGIPDHPILFFIVMFSICFRWIRAALYWQIAVRSDPDDVYFFKHPLLAYWSLILVFQTVKSLYFWLDLAEKRGWNWWEFLWGKE